MSEESDYPIIREMVCLNCGDKFKLDEWEENREFCCSRCLKEYYRDDFAYEDSYDLED